jgi:glucose/arabinose dehydrogenase
MKKSFILLLIIASFSQAQIPANLALQQLYTLTDPLTVRHAGDGSGRIFTITKGGTIRIYNGTSLLTTPFLDITSKVRSGGERGLLGLDFDPNYSSNGYFYVYYTQETPNTGDTIIERYQVSSGDPNVADANSGHIILRIDQPFSNHNGGDIHFGPDGYLYIGMGDGGSGGDPDNYAQTKNNLLGKILRINVNPDIIFTDSVEVNDKCGLDQGHYFVPSDNPFINNSGECSEMWTWGWRNPWRWSFDSQTGDMIVGDVGQNAYEEVSYQSVSSSGGENYGWSCREGAHTYNAARCDIGETYIEPVVDIDRTTNGDCSVIGGYVYRGPIVGLQGLYVFSDYCGGNINFATPNGQNTWSFTTWQDVGFGIQSFGEDEDGNIYVLQNSSVYKFILTP